MTAFPALQGSQLGLGMEPGVPPPIKWSDAPVCCRLLHGGVPGTGVCISIRHLCGHFPSTAGAPAPSTDTLQASPQGLWGSPLPRATAHHYPCLLHQGKDQLSHIHHTGRQAAPSPVFASAAPACKTTLDADPIQNRLTSFRLRNCSALFLPLFGCC